jgi:translation initiation factor eIF-2B subunit beta
VIGQQLIFAAPLELCIGNVMRRVLFIIREEYNEFKEQAVTEEDLSTSAAPPMIRRGGSVLLVPNLSDSLYVDVSEPDDGFSQPHNIKQAVLESIRGYIDDLQDIHTPISQQALEHIHEHEVVLTFGRSKTVTEFLKAASRKRHFSVIVARTAPSMTGRDTALALSKEGIDTTLISDAAVFALMPRVNKVIIGVRAVLANGGLLAQSGAYLIAMAAKAHHVPLVVLSGLYKFTPLYPSEDQDTFNNLNAPGEVLPFSESDRIGPAGGDTVVQNPAFDYVPPELVSLFISNQGPTMPSYIYRVLGEIYHPDGEMDCLVQVFVSAKMSIIRSSGYLWFLCFNFVHL